MPIESAEIILTAIIVLSATAAGIYWLWTGGSVTEVAESLGIFAFVVIILGVVRLGIEKLSDLLATLLPPPLGTRGKPRASARKSQRVTGAS